jgi:ADP-heptose:LPS heptosyltransferase
VVADMSPPVYRSDFPSPVPNRILVTLMGSLGDVARGLTMIPRLRAASPSCRITWIVEPKCEGIVRAARGIDRVLVFPRGKGLRALASFVSELRVEHYDVALDLQRHLKSGIVTWLSRAPRRIGFAPSNTKEGNWIFSTEYLGAFDEQVTNKGLIYHGFLSAIGIPPDTAPLRLPLPVVTDRLPHGLVPRRYIALVLGSSWQSKDWPITGYEKLIHLLLERTSLSLLLLGDSSHAERARVLTSQADPIRSKGRLYSAAGTVDLSGLIACVGCAAVVVGPDSGPGHIAAGLGVPVVVLFGPTAPERTAPLTGLAHNSGESSLDSGMVDPGIAGLGMVRVIRSEVGCSPCYRRACPGVGGVCMRLIRPEVVVEEVLSSLQYRGG